MISIFNFHHHFFIGLNLEILNVFLFTGVEFSDFNLQWNLNLKKYPEILLVLRKCYQNIT